MSAPVIWEAYAPKAPLGTSRWAESCFKLEGDQWSESVTALKRGCFVNPLKRRVLAERLTGRSGVKICSMLLHCVPGRSGRRENISFTRIGVFELDLRSRELHKQGMKIRLQGQPIEILAIRVERPGEIVTREELQKKLWPADTFR